MIILHKDMQILVQAKNILENPGFAIKAANYIGKPIELALEKIDSKTINNATQNALHKSLDLAIGTMDLAQLKTPSNLKHKIAVAASGATGGLFGMIALPIELPISTTIMLRSIAEIAHCKGEQLGDMQVRLECLQVFALGSEKSSDDDASESAYYAARAGLAYEMKVALKAVEGMSQKAIQESLARGNMPMLIKVIESIASRFGIAVSEKAVAQAVPLLGAGGGAGINLLFINHFQDMAKGHFSVRRLERVYGKDVVEKAYNLIRLD